MKIIEMDTRHCHNSTGLFMTALQFAKFSQHYQCFKCAQLKPNVECSNCPKFFHHQCKSQLNANLCTCCQSKVKAVCEECKTLLCKMVNLNGGTENDLNTETQYQNIKMCSLCTSMYHSSCVRKTIIKLERCSSYEFFNEGYNWVCRRCLFAKGIANVLDAKMQNDQLYYLVVVRSPSPIHRTWISQQEFKALQNQSWETANVAEMKIQKILAAKPPITYRKLTISDIINHLEQMVEKRSQLHFGGLDNFWFAVKWQNQNRVAISWQNQAVVANFKDCLCRFIVLLKYEHFGFETPLHNLYDLQVGSQYEKRAPKIKLQNPYHPIINRVCAESRQGQGLAQLLQFNAETNSKLLHEVLAKIIQSEAHQKHAHIVVTRDEQIDAITALLQSYFYNWAIVSIKDHILTDLSKFQLSFCNSFPKYDILIVTYALLCNPLFATASHFVLSEFTNDKQCISALDQINGPSKIVIMAIEDDRANTILQKIIQKKVIKKRMPLTTYHIDSLIAEMIVEEENNQLNGIQNNNFRIGKLQRMIFNDYILQNGCPVLLSQSSRIPEQLTRFKPQYRHIIQQYDADCYLQYLQLYLSTLKDFKANGQLKDSEALQMYFDIDATQIYMKICEKQRQQRQIRAS